MTDPLLARAKLDIGIQTHVRLRRGWALSEIKEHKLYEGEADSFEEYLSQDDVRKDAKACIELFNFYITEHELPVEDIEDIHYLRLTEAMKAIKLQPAKLNEYLEKCRVLSWKDLINETREARGKTPMPIQKAKHLLSPPGSPYDKVWVKQQPCLEYNCGAPPPSDPHHWPRTKAAGGKFMLPLCRKHHTLAQAHGPTRWFATGRNDRAVANYLDRAK